jgi:hypothetical protein
MMNANDGMQFVEMGLITQVQRDAFLDSLEAHIRYVREAGRKIGVPVEQLAIHDASKYTVAEFPAYARYFQGGDSPVNAESIPDEFAGAWLHHIHHNPHHPEYWMFPDGFTPKGSSVEAGVVRMPDHYALEMIADWMGASRAYTGEWEMSGWLVKNLPRIRVHSETAKFLRYHLTLLGYADIVYVDFAQESGK